MLQYRSCVNVNEFAPVVFALTLGPHKDRIIYEVKPFLNPFWAKRGPQSGF